MRQSSMHPGAVNNMLLGVERSQSSMFKAMEWSQEKSLQRPPVRSWVNQSSQEMSCQLNQRLWTISIRLSLKLMTSEIPSNSKIL